MNAVKPVSKARSRQSGMGLIELMIAMVVLAVGMLALMMLVSTSMASNSRSKLDTTGTMLAQKVLQTIASQPANQNQAVNMADCNPAGATSWTIGTTAQVTPGAGAQLTASGDVDWLNQTYTSLRTVYPSYAMRYVTCGVNGGQVTYEVRWNIRRLTNFTKLVTVSARTVNAAAPGASPRMFAPPVTLRTITGQ